MTREPLRKLVWRAFLRTALIPLLLVELALIGAYLAANAAGKSENQAAVRALAEDALARIAVQEAALIDARLSSVAQMTTLYAGQCKDALSRPYTLPDAQRDAYRMSPEGVFYTARDPGGSALFYSGAVPVGPAEQEKAFRTAQLDPVMRDILAASPLVVQVYLNTHDSMNRILPYFDVLTQYMPKMDIPSFNFYYEADARHDPERKAVWTDAYLDPAGKGWMVSCIAPVYRGDFLEGVVGLDVTTATIIREVLDLKLPWGGYGVLVGEDDTVLALPPAGEAAFGLEELKAQAKTDPVRADTFKPEAFKISHNPALAPLAAWMRADRRGFREIELGGKHAVAWATVEQTGWTLLVLAPESGIYAQSNELGARLFRLGGLMVLGLALFYAVFLGVVARRARAVAARIAAQLATIDTLVRRVGAGEHDIDPPPLEIEELAASAAGVAAVGKELGAATRRLLSAQRDAEEARDAALRASQLKSEFLATMSHELRTPLNAVITFTEMLAEELDRPEHREWSAQAGAAAGDLLRIIEDVLDLSSIEAGRIALRPAPFSPAGTLEAVAGLLAPQARARGLGMTASADPALPGSMRADESRVRQILMHLVSNAIKFTERGEIVARARLVRGDRGARVRFEVEDTGIGIPEEARARVFRMFTQVDGSHRRRFGGTGVGLSLCKRLVELMGGDIDYESEEGRGSTFWFELPLDDGAPAGGSGAVS
ncbi:MAG: ATPase [Polyangiaceae bacterium]|nr:ATPase [Polyangiaceae bacterium]